jgi:2,3-bisphosphoglycerate-independent phosphoglycerate mutase
MKKILLIILDGLGDEPIPDFGGKTPLEAASTPNLDFLAKNGMCGQAKVEFRGATPTSEGCHFCLFGYDPGVYKIRRGIIAATGTGLKAKKGDVALRGNLATVGKELNMVDRRAGRPKSPQTFIEALQGIEIKGVKFLIKSATEHRLGIIMRPVLRQGFGGQGPRLDPDVSDGDPHYGKLGKKARKIRPLEKSREAAFTAQVLNEFLEKAHQILKNHPENKKRKAKGMPEVNYVLVRGASFLPRLPSFKNKYGLRAACIAGKFLYQQIGKMLGMDLILVEGATGKPDTNLGGKFEVAKKAVEDYDFVFLHIKATDSLAEDGKFLEKKRFIEKVDGHVETLLKLKDVLIIVTCDHSTCSLKKRHCEKPCPILIFGSERDDVSVFSERTCQKGKLGQIKQINLMDKILKLSET